MQMFKKTSVPGAFARKENYDYEGKKFEADIKNGDVVTLLSAGQVVTGQFGDQTVFSIKTRNGEKNINMNQSSVNVLVDELGADSDSWVGKDVNVIIHKTMVAGKKADIAYLVTPGWKLDDYGKLVKEGAVAGPIGETAAPDFEN